MLNINFCKVSTTWLNRILYNLIFYFPEINKENFLEFNEVLKLMRDRNNENSLIFKTK